MKTTKKQYALFCAEIKKWIEIFGLKDWQIHFEHKAIAGCRARLHYDTVGCIATFILNTSWNEKSTKFLNDNTVRKSGFHEVCELLLCRLSTMVEQIYGLIELDKEEEIHRIIRTLENTIFTKKLDIKK